MIPKQQQDVVGPIIKKVEESLFRRHKITLQTNQPTKSPLPANCDVVKNKIKNRGMVALPGATDKLPERAYRSTPVLQYSFFHTGNFFPMVVGSDSSTGVQYLTDEWRAW